MQSKFIADTLENVLHEVQRPARYVGGEINSIVKEWSSDRVKVALAFPDIYDLGMSNLGLAILYELLNQRDNMLAERVYLPWQDMVGTRHRLVHGYDFVDMDILWHNSGEFAWSHRLPL